MKSTILRSLFVFLPLALMGLLPSGAARAQDFMPVDQAFQVQARVTQPGQVAIDFKVAQGTYLYRERLEARIDGPPPEPLALTTPEGERKHDPTFDKVMEVYHHDVAATLALPALPPPAQGADAAPPQTLAVVYQGCADAGLCYPPQTRHWQLIRDAQGQVTAVTYVPPQAPPARRGSGLFGSSGDAGLGASTAPGTSAGGSPMAWGGGANAEPLGQALSSGRWLMVLPAFLLAGVLLSLTPCVLPMVPILSSIIVGQHGGASGGSGGAGAAGQGGGDRPRGFALALSYSQGMALVYTLLGVAAGLLGQGLAAYLQHPYVVLTFAALMVVLALSMFGLYELRLPASVQSWLGRRTHGLPGGRFVSVFVMGAVSALIVSPCVSAPLAGALLYISQTRDLWLGGAALYAMAWGMSVPLLVVGVAGGRLLPRAGRWMNAVKVLFGVLMLAMAAWVARPAWPALVAAVTGQPVVSSHQSVLPFQRVSSVAQLEQAVADAARQGRPVMLDFYADWCVACIEMERFTFTDPAVRGKLGAAVLLQADVTANTPDDRALLERFGLFGPPGIVFFDAAGRELSARRVIGVQKPEAFVRSLEAAGL
ncbi:MAG: protein-disulfide reductase DsbD [Aquabacterium sp.]|uniref:protein-disulfide reductase DsbD n=1 Tax=Aquabacterium sp. TaxID=1872578 RepID=UPI003BAFA768